MKLNVRFGDAQPGNLQPFAKGAPANAVEVMREGNGLTIAQDGRTFEADVIEVAANTYSVLISGYAYEVRVEPAPGGLRIHAGANEFRAEIEDPRAWRGQHGGTLEAEGRQQVIAPMPGKVVRVLVAAGQKVESGQGLMVVEAMKMQNEIRSPKSGIVERIVVAEGQAVNAGEPLAIVA
ncbi:MAG TPA: biotin/lipoyl-containing protein [Candidatus Acidoferrum sp.]|nr:biotin/lipoyl-containing protein [Candidatus Acidoferrum sp.]